VIDFVSRAEGLVLALVVFAIVFGESLIVTDLVVPGEVGLVVAGAAAAANGTPVWPVIAAATLGAVAGDTCGYLIGRRFGQGVISTRRWARRLRPALHRARRHLDDHGTVTVAAARWVGALRGVVPVVAGSARLSAPRFYAPAAPSALAWCSAVVLLGFVWGDDIADVIDRVGLALSATVVVAIVVIVWMSRRRRAQPAS
jgi:membrane protein DedA with SNARE-associated domain